MSNADPESLERCLVCDDGYEDEVCTCTQIMESLDYTPADLSWARCAHLKEVARMRAELRQKVRLEESYTEQIAALEARDSAFDPNGTVADFRERCEVPLRERIAALEAEVAYREESRVNQLLVTDLHVKELEDEMKIKDEIHRMDEIAYSEMEAELTAANARITALEAEVASARFRKGKDPE